MKKTIASLFAVALGTAGLVADVGAPAPSVKNMDVNIDDVNHVETALKGVKLSGYVDAGYLYNFTGGSNANAISGRQATDSTQGGDFSVNQVNLTLQKDLSDENTLQGGFLVSVMMGEDASLFPNANASGSSSLTLEQAYVTFRAPYGNGIDFKVGKFNTLLGYELNARKNNMNITWGSDYAFAPNQEVGAEVFYAFNDNVDFTQRVVNGQFSDSDTSSFSGGKDSSDDYGFEGLLGLHNNGGNASLYAGYYVSIHDGGFGVGEDSSVMGSFNGTWKPKFANDKLTLAFSTLIGDAPNSVTGVRNLRETFVSSSLYAKYQFTDVFSLAGRAAYATVADNSINTISVGGTDDKDLWSLTLTAGFDLTENLLFRTEYRMDIGEDIYGGVDASAHTNHTLAAQVVYTF